MKIGVDARPLSDEKLAGIGTYVYKILSELADSGHEIILYSHRKIVHAINGKNIVVKTIPGKIGTFWLRYKLPKYIKKDNINVFWGTQHILPKKTKGVRYVLTVHDLALVINKNWGRGFNIFVQNRTYVRQIIPKTRKFIEHLAYFGIIFVKK